MSKHAPPVDVFPIGWYGYTLHQDEPHDIAEDCVNIVLPYHRGAQSFLELESYLNNVRAQQLKALVEIQPLNRAPSSPFDPQDPAQVNELKGFIHKLKDRPEIFGWYLYDEPPNVDGLIPARAHAASCIIRSEDPNRPIGILFSASVHPGPYSTAMDAHMVDDYRVMGSKEFDFDGFGYFRFLSQQQMRAPRIRPYWVVLQAFPNDRFTTRAEQRYFNYMAVQAGATGLFFYKHEASTPEWRNDVLNPTLKEFSLHAKVFANGRLKVGINTGHAAAVATLYRDPDDHSLVGGRFTLLVVHHGNGTVNITLRIDPSSRLGTPILKSDGGRTVKPAKGVYRDDLGPYEVRLYTFAL
jgi:hypothetical protein